MDAIKCKDHLACIAFSERVKMLHVLNGDSIASTFRKTGIQGDVLVWREALVMGPCPAGLSDGQWIKTRAKHLSETYGTNLSDCSSSLRNQFGMLAKAASYSEVVLWFEFDLFCQVNLICILNALSSLNFGSINVSLICIDSFPGIESFLGLGQLNIEQLAGLFNDRITVTEPMLLSAATAWLAYTSASPHDVATITQDNPTLLPQLKNAFQAHLARFPSLKNGLGRIENELLDFIASGFDEFVTLFQKFSESSPIYGFGDVQIWRHLAFLSRGQNPLLTICNPGKSADQLPAGNNSEIYFKLTDTGKAILVGNSDMLNVNTVDYWLGGVHLRNETTWRWNSSEQRLMHCLP